MKELRPALLMFLLFTVICGGIYPALVTGIAYALFPRQAQGSIITDQNHREIGSALIGQPFSNARYVWPRPSATADFGYNPMASGGSNSGPTNPDYLKTVSERVKTLHDAGAAGGIPSGLVQASGSGLDPDLAPEAAMVQVARIAKARGMATHLVERLVTDHTKGRQLGFLGEPRVNVLELNLALDNQESR
ncbi:potassium-transporting ATPase subunit KdpC [Geomonas agri]|uniref:potassium-transporting ATPase subunit KdpC n=1 Tax=Geomonas agri TaxID=2873702 RepID=UPI001CD5C5D6|nr:potassium-transporting ATPase subunit KdpC [Geomonas agri]